MGSSDSGSSIDRDLCPRIQARLCGHRQAEDEQRSPCRSSSSSSSPPPPPRPGNGGCRLAVCTSPQPLISPSTCSSSLSLSSSLIRTSSQMFVIVFLLSCSSLVKAQYKPQWPDPLLAREIFVLNLEDGYYGCQVNDSADFLQLFELSKLCDGSPQCFRGSDEMSVQLKCTDRGMYITLYCMKIRYTHLHSHLCSCMQFPLSDMLLQTTLSFPSFPHTINIVD